jgi:hypothetical protein
LIDKMVASKCERLRIERFDYRFTRATVRQHTGWGDSQLKKHLSRLEDLEYLALHRGAPGQSFVYALNFEMDANGRPVLPGLSYGGNRVPTDRSSSVGYENRSRSEEGVSRFEAGVTPSGHGQDTGVSRGGDGAQSPAMTRAGDPFREKNGKHRDRETEANVLPVVVVPVSRPNGHALHMEVK